MVSQLILTSIIFFFGLAIGSFLNVVIDRLPQGQSLWGRSHCDACHTTLEWDELIPVLSFCLLKGKCKHCQQLIGWQYFLVELTTGFLFVLFFIKHNYIFSFELLATLTVVSILLSLLVIDLKYQIILDELIVFLFLIGLLSNQSFLVYFLPGMLFFTMSFWLLNHLSYGRAMGYGDVKLVFCLAMIFPFVAIFLGLYLAFLTGGLVSVILILSKNKGLKSKIAFGPFITLAFILILWFVSF